MKQIIENLVGKILKKTFELEKVILVDIPKDESADFSINTPLQCSKELGKNPKEIAETLKEKIIEADTNKLFENVEVSGPGFIYFTLSEKALLSLLESETTWGNTDLHSDKKIMIEFAHPNTHKAFHIGHVRNICLGESIVRLKESQGIETFRANYQGDIGPHVAKCLWALQKEPQEKIEEITQSSGPEKAGYLGKLYALGGTTYEKDETAKKEIHEINKALYEDKASEDLKELYIKSRQWSLDYFEYIYEKFGTPRFDHYFFESESWKPGKELVERNIGKVFQESNGATIFPGEDFGLHTRVFISGEGNPTYEAKDLGLAPMQYEKFNFDTCIHVVGNEQAEYFKVVFKAMEQLSSHEECFKTFGDISEKEKHLSYGMVKLTSGKMSSRTGDVITGEWLINEAKTAIMEKLEGRDLTDDEKENIAEMVAIGAIKFTMLHTQAKNDIAFDLEKAVRLDGDSGPYLQYAHARINSILEKNSGDDSNADFSQFNEIDWKLLKKAQYLPYHIERCAKELTVHHVSHYLLQLAATFSSWYAVNSVQNAETEELKNARIQLLQFIKLTIKNGLYIMGIEAPEKM